MNSPIFPPTAIELGRVVYLARSLANSAADSVPDADRHVVIKQFQFACSPDWSGFKAIEREIAVLQGLDHPGIPRYLGSLATEDGFGIVQEYKQAKPLSEPQSFAPEEIKLEVPI